MARKHIRLRKLAKRAGVSPTTASRVFNGSNIPTKETKQRVLEIAKELGYKNSADTWHIKNTKNIDKPSNTSSTKSAETKTHFIALLVPEIDEASFNYDNPHYGAAMQGMQQVLEDNDYNLIFQIKNKSNKTPKLIEDKQVDGALLWRVSNSSPVVNDICKQIPTVAIESEITFGRSDSVMLNAGLAMTKQLEYLWSLGHRQIAYFEQKSSIAPKKHRQRAFKEFFESKNEPAPLPQLNYPRDITPQTHEAVLNNFAQELLQVEHKPTALITTSGCARSLIYHLQIAGIKIPKDISVISCNDDWNGGHLIHPALSTYYMPTQELGNTAARMLLERIDNPALPSRHVLLDGFAIERASCDFIKESKDINEHQSESSIETELLEPVAT